VLIDYSGLPIYGLNGLSQADEHSAYSPLPFTRQQEETDTSARNSEQTLSYFRLLQLPLRRHFKRQQQRKLFREVVATISGSGHVIATTSAKESGGQKAESVWSERWNGGREEAESVDAREWVVRDLNARWQVVSVWYEVLQQVQRS